MIGNKQSGCLGRWLWACILVCVTGSLVGCKTLNTKHVPSLGIVKEELEDTSWIKTTDEEEEEAEETAATEETGEEEVPSEGAENEESAEETDSATGKETDQSEPETDAEAGESEGEEGASETEGEAETESADPNGTGLSEQELATPKNPNPDLIDRLQGDEHRLIELINLKEEFEPVYDVVPPELPPKLLEKLKAQAATDGATGGDEANEEQVEEGGEVEGSDGEAEGDEPKEEAEGEANEETAKQEIGIIDRSMNWLSGAWDQVYGLFVEPTEDELMVAEVKAFDPKVNDPIPAYLFAPGVWRESQQNFYSVFYTLWHGKMSLCLAKFRRSMHNLKEMTPGRVDSFGWVYEYDVISCSSDYQSSSEMQRSWEGCRKIENTLFSIERRQRRLLSEFNGGNILHFMRKIFPAYFAGFEVSPINRWEKVLNRIEKVASARITDTKDLVYGDVLLGSTEDKQISIYVGHGIIASFNQGRVTYGPMSGDYQSAFRVIPAFGVCDYRPDGQSFLKDVSLLR